MRIRVINPNTSVGMTKSIRLSAQEAAGPGTEIVCCRLARGPEYAGCAYDNVLVSYELVRVIQEDERNGGYDAYVVASFADPALDAVRELTCSPVSGIAEAAIHFSVFLGCRFSLLSTMPRMTMRFEEEVRRAGGMDRLASIKVPACQVAGLLQGDETEKTLLAASAREAVEQDGAEVLILGGGVFAGYRDFLTKAAGVPVLDGVQCAVKMAEALAGLGLKTSKARTYGPPPAKNYVE